MEKRLLFSIIVPVYNAEKYLAQCMDSLLGQDIDKDEYEIICINDGSKDNSLAILQEYAKNNSNVVVVDKENGGVSKARNLGLDMAKGEYVWFVDADDWIARNCLGSFAQEISKKEPSIIAFDLNIVPDETGRPIDFFNKSLVQRKKGFPFYVCAVSQAIIKKGLINKWSIKFLEHIHYAEDTIFVRDCFDSMRLEEDAGGVEHLKIAHIAPAVYFYRKNEASATGQSLTKNRMKYIQSLLSRARLDRERMNEEDKPQWYRKQYESLATRRMVDCMLFWVPGSDVDLNTTLQSLKAEGLFPCKGDVRSALGKTKGAKGKIVNFYRRMACRYTWVYRIYFKQMTKHYQKANDKKENVDA